MLPLTIPSLTYIYRVPLRSPLFTKTPYIYCGLIPWAQNILYVLQKWFSFTKSALHGSKPRAFDFCTLTLLRRGPLHSAIFASSKRCFQNLGLRAQHKLLFSTIHSLIRTSKWLQLLVINKPRKGETKWLLLKESVRQT